MKINLKTKMWDTFTPEALILTEKLLFCAFILFFSCVFAFVLGWNIIGLICSLIGTISFAVIHQSLLKNKHARRNP